MGAQSETSRADVSLDRPILLRGGPIRFGQGCDVSKAALRYGPMQSRAEAGRIPARCRPTGRSMCESG